MDYSKLFDFISKNPDLCEKLLNTLKEELDLPVVPFPTMGGKVFWTTFAEVNGWKLQQNMVTKHARILDSNDIRIAWGTIEGMEKALDRMVTYTKKYQ